MLIHEFHSTNERICGKIDAIGNGTNICQNHSKKKGGGAKNRILFALAQSEKILKQI